MKLSAIIFILWIIVILLSIRSHKNKNKNEQLTKFNRLSWKESITYGLIMLILFGGVGFLVPPKININGTIIDILAHLLGFIAGLAISFWFIILKNKNKKNLTL
jgi:protein-S-isoprenylcysteine O-methyltransferase Ste14